MWQLDAYQQLELQQTVYSSDVDSPLLSQLPCMKITYTQWDMDN